MTKSEKIQLWTEITRYPKCVDDHIKATAARINPEIHSPDAPYVKSMIKEMGFIHGKPVPMDPEIQSFWLSYCEDACIRERIAAVFGAKAGHDYANEMEFLEFIAWLKNGDKSDKKLRDRFANLTLDVFVKAAGMDGDVTRLKDLADTIGFGKNSAARKQAEACKASLTRNQAEALQASLTQLQDSKLKEKISNLCDFRWVYAGEKMLARIMPLNMPGGPKVKEAGENTKIVKEFLDPFPKVFS